MRNHCKHELPIIPMILGAVCLLLVWGQPAWTQNIPLRELPEKVRQTIESTAQANGFTVRNANKGVQGGREYYLARGRNADNATLNIIVSTDGELIDRYRNNQFRIYQNQLYYERSPYRIQTILAPDAGNPNLAPGAMIHAISAVSKVGCNALAIDLHGFNPDGTRLDSGTMDYLHSLMSRLNYSSIELVIRVLGKDAPQDDTGRMNAVQTAARVLQDFVQAVYVIDGKNAAALAQSFKSAAPNLVVAAPGGDLDFVSSEKEIFMKKYLKKPLMYFGVIPGDPDTSVHFILPDQEKSYSWVDEKNAYPLEKRKWVPDNSVLSESERAAGFISLFDGKTLDGWTVMGGNKNGFVVRDGMIEYNERGGGGLQTRDRYDNFILRFEYKIADNANNGVHLRAPRSNRASKVGFEIQMYGDYGREPNKNSTGAVYDVVAPTMNASKPAGEWNEMEIIAVGPYLRVTLNEHVVQNIHFDENEELRYRLRDGFIRITDHNDYVAYRNIRVKRL